jgi:hypothetical protein
VEVGTVVGLVEGTVEVGTLGTAREAEGAEGVEKEALGGSSFFSLGGSSFVSGLVSAPHLGAVKEFDGGLIFIVEGASKDAACGISVGMVAAGADALLRNPILFSAIVQARDPPSK